jgi:hypothetical protein
MASYQLNNNAIGTAITQIHEDAHSLFTLSVGTRFIQEPPKVNGKDLGDKVADCVRKNHGITK